MVPSNRSQAATVALAIGVLVCVVALAGCLAEDPQPSRLELQVVNGDTTERTVEVTITNQSSDRIATRRFTVGPNETTNASHRLSPGQYTVNVSSDTGVYLPRKVDLESDCRLSFLVAVGEQEGLDTTKSDCLEEG